MQIQYVNNTDFTGKEKEFKKSYMSRVAGTGVGAGLAYLVLKNEKPFSIKTKKSILDGFYKGFLKKSKAESVDDAIKNILGITRKQFNAERTGIIKKILKMSKGVAAALLVLGGLIAGGIVDRVINKKRAQKVENV